jgi:cytochrome P450
MRFCTEMCHERRIDPKDDLFTEIAEAKIDGKPLTDTELGYNGLMFFAAGHETTRSSLCAGLLELIRDPAQMGALRRMRHDGAALRNAANEFVRWSSPLTHQLREATEDTMIGDKQVKAGDWVALWLASANRDEAVFEEAGRFDITRNASQHVGFGVGKHFCIGAQLARLDMQVALEDIIDHMSGIELDGDIEMSGSNLFWGIKHMPIKFRATPPI